MRGSLISLSGILSESRPRAEAESFLGARQREFLRSLDDSSILALLLPHLRTRLEWSLDDSSLHSGGFHGYLEHISATMAPFVRDGIELCTFLHALGPTPCL